MSKEKKIEDLKNKEVLTSYDKRQFAERKPRRELREKHLSQSWLEACFYSLSVWLA